MCQLALQEEENIFIFTQEFLSVSPVPQMFQIEIPILTENSVDRESDLLLFKSSLTQLPRCNPKLDNFSRWKTTQQGPGPGLNFAQRQREFSLIKLTSRIQGLIAGKPLKFLVGE